jgi:hypothetical protein
MNFNQRLAAIEGRLSRHSDACPHCGANWHGSVIIIDDRPACIRCGGEREAPRHPVKSYDGEMMGENAP